MRNALLALVTGAILAAPAALAQQRGTGLVYLEPERYRSIPLAPPVALTGVPAEFDMSKDFPTPGDQGQQGSCVGWAVGYALKSFQERRERNWTNWDDTKRMSPAFVYNQVKVGGCGDGARIADALGLLSSDGSAAWTDQPYNQEDCDTLPTALARQNAGMNRIAGWFRVNPQDITVVKAHLAAGMPIVIGMGVDQSFQQLEGAEVWTGTPGPRADGHAMVIVGYSDKRNAVKVINSWGTGWADKGFGWIDYEAFRRAVREAYVAQDVVLPVGVAERREHPYLVKDGPYGPEAFGVKLGMRRTQIDSSLTREAKWSTFTSGNGELRSRATIEAPDLGVAGKLLLDATHDHLTEISIRQELGYNDPVMDAVVDALNRQSASDKLKFYTRSVRRDGYDNFFFPPQTCAMLAAELGPAPQLARRRFSRILSMLSFQAGEIDAMLAPSRFECIADERYAWLTIDTGGIEFVSEQEGIKRQVVASGRRHQAIFDLESMSGESCFVLDGKFYLSRSDSLIKADRNKPLPDCKFVAERYRYGFAPSIEVTISAVRDEPKTLR